MLPLAALLPMLATIAQGTGGGVSDLFKAKNLYTQSDKERLAELKRLQLLGQLGYTQQELGTARNEMLAPLQAQARELRQTGSLGSLGGDTLKAQQAAQSKLGHELGNQTSRLASMNADKAAQQEVELRNLEHARDQQKIARNAAIIETLTGGLAGGAQAQQIFQSQRADKEAFDAMMDTPIGEQAKTAGITDPIAFKKYLEFMGKYGVDYTGNNYDMDLPTPINTYSPSVSLPAMSD